MSAQSDQSGGKELHSLQAGSLKYDVRFGDRRWICFICTYLTFPVACAF